MSKAKLNKNDFKFDKKKDETLIKVPGQINGRDFLISNLEGCEVYLMDHIAQIFVDDCKNCTIYIGPVEASVFIRDCDNLKVSAACSQYRISDSTNIDSFVYSQTDPTLEKCRNLRFAPYNFAYPLQNEHFEKAKLDPTKNHWSQVFDFNENKQDPNWTILPPEEYPGPVEKTVEGLENPVNPVEINKEYGGTLDAAIIVGSQEAAVGGEGQGEEGMMAFDIKTGMEQAQNTFENTQEQAGSATLQQEEQHVVEEERHEEHVSPTHDQTQGQTYEEQHYEEQHQEHEEPQYEKHHEEQQEQFHEQAQYGGGQEFEFHQEQHAQEYVSQGHEQQQQQQYQAGGHDFDDMFGGGGASTTIQSTPVNQSYASQQQQGYPAYQAGGYGYGENYDPEEEERQERLRRLEYERSVRLEEKARIEREKKQEKISKAATDLNQWHSERLQNIEKRKKLNEQNQEIQREASKEEQFKNPWEKIVANIALKEGEYPGTKDVTRFRQSLVNKKLDAAKGLGSDLPF